MGISERSGSHLAVSFASLFIVLACLIWLPTAEARGTDVWLAKSEGRRPGSVCGDGRPIFVRLKAEDNLVINRVDFSRQQGEDHLRNEMSSRAERVVYVMVDEEVMYDQFAGLVSRIHADSDPIYVVLVTKKVRSEPWQCDIPVFAPLEPLGIRSVN